MEEGSGGYLDGGRPGYVSLSNNIQNKLLESSIIIIHMDIESHSTSPPPHPKKKFPDKTLGVQVLMRHQMY